MKTCLICGKEITGKNKTKKKYCSIRCSNKSRAKLDYSDCKTKKEKRAKYFKHYYSDPKNKQKHIQRVKKTNEANKTKLRQKYNEYKSNLSCSQCGENHPATLDFHHTDPTNKLDRVANLIANGQKWKIILAEIKKCIVLCANCHRKLHYEQDNL